MVVGLQIAHLEILAGFKFGGRPSLCRNAIVHAKILEDRIFNLTVLTSNAKPPNLIACQYFRLNVHANLQYHNIMGSEEVALEL